MRDYISFDKPVSAITLAALTQVLNSLTWEEYQFVLKGVNQEAPTHGGHEIIAVYSDKPGRVTPGVAIAETIDGTRYRLSARDNDRTYPAVGDTIMNWVAFERKLVGGEWHPVPGPHQSEEPRSEIAATLPNDEARQVAEAIDDLFDRSGWPSNRWIEKK